jgi:hypothetical protein
VEIKKIIKSDLKFLLNLVKKVSRFKTTYFLILVKNFNCFFLNKSSKDEIITRIYEKKINYIPIECSKLKFISERILILKNKLSI